MDKQDFSYQPKSAWEIYQSPEQIKQMQQLATKYINFLTTCKTERETIAYIRKVLEDAGFSLGFKGHRGFKVLQDKCLFAIKRGKGKLAKGINLLASHADTPRLDLKQRPLIEQANLVQAKTHYYGGIRKYQWLARPLALHGSIFLENGEVLDLRLGESESDPVFTIADLLPHLASKHNEKKISDAFEAEKLNAILAHNPLAKDSKGKKKEHSEEQKDEGKKKDSVKIALLQLLHKQYQIKEEDLISAELQIVPAGPAKFVGLDRSLIGGYGQDDRICVFCSLEAFLSSEQADRASAIIFWDKEEIGSDGATGASSKFLEFCLEEVKEAWAENISFGEMAMQMQAISADVQAALDPDFQDVHDLNNVARLGYGPCFSKFTGSRGKYGASEADAAYFAKIRAAFNKQNIPWQVAETGKVDVGGGGTVALFLAAYAMNVIDCGTAVLSMHSPFEIASVSDLFATTNAYKCFLEQV